MGILAGSNPLPTIACGQNGRRSGMLPVVMMVGMQVAELDANRRLSCLLLMFQTAVRDKVASASLNGRQSNDLTPAQGTVMIPVEP